MHDVLLFDLLYLVPAATVGIIVAIVLLVLRRKKNGVRPPHAGAYLGIAIALFVFAAITIVAIPFVCFVTYLIQIIPQFIYAALKSL